MPVYPASCTTTHHKNSRLTLPHFWPGLFHLLGWRRSECIGFAAQSILHQLLPGHCLSQTLDCTTFTSKCLFTKALLLSSIRFFFKLSFSLLVRKNNISFSSAILLLQWGPRLSIQSVDHRSSATWGGCCHPAAGWARGAGGGASIWEVRPRFPVAATSWAWFGYKGISPWSIGKKSSDLFPQIVKKCGSRTLFLY